MGPAAWSPAPRGGVRPPARAFRRPALRSRPALPHQARAGTPGNARRGGQSGLEGITGVREVVSHGRNEILSHWRTGVGARRRLCPRGRPLRQGVSRVAGGCRPRLQAPLPGAIAQARSISLKNAGFAGPPLQWRSRRLSSLAPPRPRAGRAPRRRRRPGRPPWARRRACRPRCAATPSRRACCARHSSAWASARAPAPAASSARGWRPARSRACPTRRACWGARGGASGAGAGAGGAAAALEATPRQRRPQPPAHPPHARRAGRGQWMHAGAWEQALSAAGSAGTRMDQSAPHPIPTPPHPHPTPPHPTPPHPTPPHPTPPHPTPPHPTPPPCVPAPAQRPP
jgi:hypothetical protein